MNAHAHRAPRRTIRRTLAQRLESAILALCGNRARVRSHRETPWASITFSGTRHELSLEFEGEEAIDAAEQLIEELSEHEFALPGQLVADAAVIEVDHRLAPDPRMTVTVSLLLLEEC